MFHNVVGHRIDAVDNESLGGAFLMNLGKSINAWNGVPRVQAMVL